MTKVEVLKKFEEIKSLLLSLGYKEEEFDIDESPDEPDFCQLSFGFIFIITPDTEMTILTIAFDLDTPPDFSAILIQSLIDGGYNLHIMECYWICPNCNEMHWGEDMYDHRENYLREEFFNESDAGHA